MKKSGLYTLVIFAGVALCGLIGVQTYWIKNVYKLKEQQFSQLVSTTMNFIAEDVQNFETVQIIYGVDLPRLPFRDNLESNSMLDSIISMKRQTNLPFLLNNANYAENIFWENYWQINGFMQQRFMQINTQFDDNRFGINTSSSSAMAFLLPPISREERRARGRILNETIDARLQQTNLKLEDRINGEILDYFIRYEMEKSNINIPFEYAVYGKNGDCRIIYQSENYAPIIEDKIFRASLFPFDWTGLNPYYLNIYFPKQGNYLFRTIGVVSFSSFIFTLVIILTFAATFYQMQRQKKITSIRTDFVNNVTHELKTPISTISLASQMLNDKSIPNEAKNFEHISTVISGESKRLSQQVEKILQMAIFDSGRLMIKFKELDINELIGLVVHNMSIQVKNKNGQIIKSLKAENSIVEVDEVHFTNVLFNLIDNAIKYSAGRPDICISTADAPNGLSVSISDNGVGISKADQKRIFDQFFRVSTGNVHNVKGFGLGLSYVKNVVSAHNGKIEIESEQGQGAKFTVHLKHRQQNQKMNKLKI